MYKEQLTGRRTKKKGKIINKRKRNVKRLTGVEV
jgi:hypothetical protein